jgi:serine O-acetyltransferase
LSIAHIDLKAYLKADLYRYNGTEAKCNLFKALLPKMPAYRYTYLLRHASAFPNTSCRGIIYRVFLLHYSYKYGYQIQPNTRIGKGLYLGHWGPVVINGLVELGDNCTLSHLVTIGQTNRGNKSGTPKIGNRVCIGTGAVVVGKISIGDNVLIAPNAFVNFNVPSNSIVIGNPAIIREDAHATEGYIKYAWNERGDD